MLLVEVLVQPELRTMNNKNTCQKFDALLASYAVHNCGNHFRQFEENDHPHKLPFQRDLDRIIHSKAFRRLKHKTQVVVSPKDDHIRDRLTHSIEGSQIARGICRQLQLNEDLAEAAILAHDLGHPPFGHEGEHALDQMLKPLGFNFDHNQQSLRIVTKLEQNYPDFNGLNLAEETLAALRKHEVPWEDTSAPLPHQAHLEAQVVNRADEISYYSHDVDDGIRADLINPDALFSLEIGRQIKFLLNSRYPNLSESHESFHPQIQRALVHILISDLIKTTEENIKQNNIKGLEDIFRLDFAIINFSDNILQATEELRSYLFKNFYLSKTVKTFTQEGKELLQELFTKFHDNPELLPKKQQDLINNPEPKEIIIKDYIAGMTDQFAKCSVMKLRKR